jgi:hypothetical protein
VCCLPRHWLVDACSCRHFGGEPGGVQQALQTVRDRLHLPGARSERADARPADADADGEASTPRRQLHQAQQRVRWQLTHCVGGVTADGMGCTISSYTFLDFLPATADFVTTFTTRLSSLNTTMRFATSAASMEPCTHRNAAREKHTRTHTTSRALTLRHAPCALTRTRPHTPQRHASESLCTCLVELRRAHGGLDDRLV